MMTPCLLGAYLLLGENEVNLKDSLAYTLLYLACFNILRELVRQDAERVRQDAERVRQDAEQARQDAEQARQDAERVRQDAERVRQDAERVRQDAERVRQDVERVRQDAERVRPLNFRAIIISQRIAEDIASGQIPAA